MEKLKQVGNIQSLLNFSTHADQFCFRKLFQNCTSLIQAPDFLAETAGQYAYGSTLGKTSITNVPKISALTMGNSCCYYMFEDCPITEAPDLPATSIGKNAYQYMFNNCTSLKKGPEISATIIDENSMQFMFNGCTEMETGPSILPATTLKKNCYGSMFKHCYKLKYGPIISGQNLVTTCCSNMFTGCEVLERLEVSFSSWVSGCTNYWFSEIDSNNSNGIFICPSALDTTTRDSSHVLPGWTIITK